MVLRHSARAFSTSSARRVDLSSLYNRLTSWRRPQSTPKKLHDPTQQGEDAAREDMPADGAPRRLRMLGKPRSIYKDWPSVKKYAEFTAWPTNHHLRTLTAEEISGALKQAFVNGDADVADVAKRFEAVKLVQQKLQIAVPDMVLTTMQSVDDLRLHLEAAARPYDEKAPDALYFDPAEFEGTNIVFKDHVGERRVLKKRYNALLKEARAEHETQAAERLKSAPSS